MALTLCNKKKGCSFWQQCAYVLHVEIAAVDDFINLRHPHIALLSLFPEWLSLIKQVWVKRGLHWNWKSPIYFKSPFTHRRLSNPQEGPASRVKKLKKRWLQRPWNMLSNLVWIPSGSKSCEKSCSAKVGEITKSRPWWSNESNL